MANCKVCSKDFIPAKTRPKQEYCSKTCYNKVANKRHSAYKKTWASKNKEAVVLSKQKWLENNPEKRKESSNSFRKRNKPYYTAYASLRSRKVMQAQPVWANKEDILSVYEEAAYFGLEVDHIIPITHKLVCGLHVWDNLQLLSRSDNAKKSNRFSVDEDILAIEKE
jgi:hypothetical protein